MNKFVILGIGIIFVTSIVLINFFGLNIDVYRPTIYVETIEILDDRDMVYDDSYGGNIITLNLDVYGEVLYLFNLKIMPTNATNLNVSFAYDEEAIGIDIDDFRKATFSSTGFYSVQIRAVDGSNTTSKVSFRILGPVSV